MGLTNNYRRALGALGLVVLLHLLALFTGPLLVPAIDLARPLAERADAVAAHPTLWRMAWLPWQAAAVANVLFAVALVLYLIGRTGPRPPLGWAVAGMLSAIAAAAFDLSGEAIYTTVLPGQTGDLRAFAESEGVAADLCSTRANTLYVAMSWCWLMAVVELRGGWQKHKGLFGLGLASLGCFLAFGGLNAKALAAPTEDGSAPVAESMALLGGIAFVLYIPFLLGLAIELGRDHHGTRRPTDAGSRFRWPRAGAMEMPAALISEPGIRDLIRPLVVRRPTLRSDVTDCVYVSWLVPAERVAGLLPEGLELDVNRNGDAVVTILSYRHGGFGPQRLGQLRRRLPSPRQANLRLYLAPERKGAPRNAIWFWRATVDSLAYAVGARLLADGLPAQYADAFEHRRDGEGWWTRIAPGFSDAPDLRLRVHEVPRPKPAEAWTKLFREWEDLVWHIVGVDRGVRVLPGLEGKAETAIDVRFEFDDVLPAEIVEFSSELIGPIVEGCPALAFVVPRLTFRVLRERIVRG